MGFSRVIYGDKIITDKGVRSSMVIQFRDNDRAIVEIPIVFEMAETSSNAGSWSWTTKTKIEIPPAAKSAIIFGQMKVNNGVHLGRAKFRFNLSGGGVVRESDQQTTTSTSYVDKTWTWTNLVSTDWGLQGTIDIGLMTDDASETVYAQSLSNYQRSRFKGV